MTAERWSPCAYLIGCLALTLPVAGIGWLIAGKPPLADANSVFAGLSAAWLNAILAAIINRHVFQRHPNAFLAWALLGNGFRLLLVVVAVLILAALLPPPIHPFFLVFLTGYLTFLIYEVFLLHNLSRRAADPVLVSDRDGSAQAE